MPRKFEEDEVLDKVDDRRREFIRKVIVGTAFAVPIVNSFSMKGLKIDLAGKMAKADEYDQPYDYDQEFFSGSGGGGMSGGGMGMGMGYGSCPS